MRGVNGGSTIGLQRKTRRLAPRPVANAFGSPNPSSTRTGTCRTCSMRSSRRTYGARYALPPSSQGVTKAKRIASPMKQGAAASHHQRPMRRARPITIASAKQRKRNAPASASQFPIVACT